MNKDAGGQERAKIEFDEAAQHVRLGSYEQALAAFQRSHKMHPNPDALFNIAMCYKALSRYGAAYLAFEQYLDSALTQDHDIRYRVSAEQAIDELRQRVSQIRVSPSIQQTAVRVDGDVVEILSHSGTIVVDPGVHEIAIEAEGFVPFTTKIDCPEGTVLELATQMIPVEATVQVSCHDDSATVIVDDVEIGGCESQTTIQPGSHRIRVESSDKEPFQTLVDAQAGQQLRLTAVLENRQDTEIQKDVGSLTRDKVDATSRYSKARRLAGILALSLGAAGSALGLTFQIVGYQEVQSTEQKKEEYRKTADSRTYEEIEHARKETIPALRNGMIAGYATGLALVTTGIVLLVIEAKSKSRNKIAQRFDFLANGFSVRF